MGLAEVDGSISGRLLVLFSESSRDVDSPSEGAHD